VFRIAKELGKFAWEVEEEMPVSEFFEWAEYFQMEYEAEKEAARKAKTQARRR